MPATRAILEDDGCVVVIVVRDALTDQRRCGAFVSVVVLPALQVIMYAAPSPSWSFGFKLSVPLDKFQRTRNSLLSSYMLIQPAWCWSEVCSWIHFALAY